MMRSFAFVLLGSICLLAAAEEPAAPAKEMGDLWEVTAQPTMEGAPMELPAHKSKVCIQKDQSPVTADERHKCANTEFNKNGSKVTWKTVCEGGMKGEGEITYSDGNNYTGAIKLTSPQGNMTVKLTGKSLETPCELKKK